MAIRKVLIVDDDEDIRRVTEIALRRIGGWEVVHAASGAECLARAREERPDVILLDVMMPDGDGPTTLARLREDPATSELPVIFLTARVQKSELEAYGALGATGVLEKPFDATTLPDAVRRLVEGGAAAGAARGDELASLREDYRRRLPEKLAQLGARLRSAELAPHERERTEAARELAHSLKGSSGTLGFTALSADLRRIEEALEELLAGSASGGEAFWSALAESLRRARLRLP
jgi:CheY-like chemotaxis protein